MSQFLLANYLRKNYLPLLPHSITNGDHTDMESITCKNCNNIYTGNYCNSCGQKATVHKITWSHMAHDFTHAIFHLDKGIVHTAKELATRPGYSIREYLEGKRVKHFNPLLMLILIGGFCSFLYGKFQLRTLFSPLRIHDLELHSSFIAHKYFAIIMATACIIFTIGDFLMFWRRKYSFPELFIANAFLCGEILLFEILLIPVFLIGRQLEINDYIRWVCIGLIFAYCFITKYQFFDGANHKSVVIRIIFSLLIYLVLAYMFTNKVLLPMFTSGK